jgi:hypothetical protein
VVVELFVTDVEKREESTGLRRDSYPVSTLQFTTELVGRRMPWE